MNERKREADGLPLRTTTIDSRSVSGAGLADYVPLFARLARAGLSRTGLRSAFNDRNVILRSIRLLVVSATQSTANQRDAQDKDRNSSGSLSTPEHCSVRKLREITDLTVVPARQRLEDVPGRSRPGCGRRFHRIEPRGRCHRRSRQFTTPVCRLLRNCQPGPPAATGARRPNFVPMDPLPAQACLTLRLPVFAGYAAPPPSVSTKIIVLLVPSPAFSRAFLLLLVK